MVGAPHYVSNVSSKAQEGSFAHCSASAPQACRRNAHSDGQRCQRSDASQKSIESFLSQPAPYGPLVQTRSLAREADGEHFTWHHTNPFALMWIMCKINPRFANFMKVCYDGASPTLRKVALYSDETTPGNQLRPDNSRQLQAIYFALLFFHIGIGDVCTAGGCSGVCAPPYNIS